MIYLDSSVVLAHLLTESRRPPAGLWGEALFSSRLLQYEVWNRLHAQKLGAEHRSKARELIDRIHFIELAPAVLGRALEPFPVMVRTLDALHLATVEFLRAGGQTLELASYDARLLEAARALGIRRLEL